MSTPRLNFSTPTCVRFLPMGKAPAMLLAKPSTCTCQFKVSILPDSSKTSTMSAALGHDTFMLLTATCIDLSSNDNKINVFITFKNQFYN